MARPSSDPKSSSSTPPCRPVASHLDAVRPIEPRGARACTGMGRQAFTALKESGNVISWGLESDGGRSQTSCTHQHVTSRLQGDILARPEDRGEAMTSLNFAPLHGGFSPCLPCFASFCDKLPLFGQKKKNSESKSHTAAFRDATWELNAPKFCYSSSTDATSRWKAISPHRLLRFCPPPESR